MRRMTIFLLCLAVAFMVSACGTTRGATVAEKRQAVQDMRQEVLAKLYEVRPGARARVQSAPGYAVFSNANVNVILASFSGGNF